MAEDRARDPRRVPNLGLPDFATAVKSEHRYKKPKPNVEVTKRTELPTATREIMLEKDKPARKDDEARKDLEQSKQDYLESKEHGER